MKSIEASFCCPFIVNTVVDHFVISYTSEGLTSLGLDIKKEILFGVSLLT